QADRQVEMISIKLSPFRGDQPAPSVSTNGFALTINGEVFDFSPLQAGQALPATAVNSEWFTDEITRAGDTLFVTLRLPYGLNPSDAVAFPDPIRVTKAGTVKLPLDAGPDLAELPWAAASVEAP
ncbi:hypothetical protein, partial [Pseudomonas sp. PA15(2017)]|uniref:hypothetical protein n=1 Tax=Pseudomonas sp. PA15(2017) TaxID=1932111 RepID=UPI001C439F02